MSTVRDNLMTREGYSPYCGNIHCSTMPRTSWTGKQFKCGSCGWVSSFPPDFIAEYKAKWGKGSNATMTIGGVDMQVRICDAQMTKVVLVGGPDQIAPLSLGLADESSVFFGFDPGAPEGDRTVVWPPIPESVTFKTTEEVKGDTKRFFESMFESAERDRAFDPWADTHRLNDLGRAPNRQRDVAEFECRFAMRGTPLVVTKEQAEELEAIDFDKSLYRVGDYDVIVIGGGSRYDTGRPIALRPLEYGVRVRPAERNQNRLRDRWGRLKR